MSPDSERRAYLDPVLWTLCAAGLALRGALLALYPYRRFDGDEGLHYVCGVLTANHGTELLGHWAPGYETFLGAVFRLAGPDPLTPLIAQVALSTWIIVLVYGIARAAGGRRAGRIAAGLAAFYPSLVAYSHFYFNETLFIALWTSALWVWMGRSGETRPRHIIVVGLLVGLAALTRSIVLWFLPLWAAWTWLRGRRAEAAQVAAVLVVALATVLPWTLRNAQKYGGFLLVDGTMGRTLYLAYSRGESWESYGRDLGYAPEPSEGRIRPACPTRDVPDVEPLPPLNALRRLFPPVVPSTLLPHPGLNNKIEKARAHGVLDLVHRQRCELSGALAYAREHPGWVVRQTLERFYRFWGPNSFLLRAVHRGRYPDGPLARPSYPIVRWIVVLGYAGVVVAALLSLGRSPLSRAVEWSALFAVYLSAVQSMSVAHSRYRLPWIPFAIVMAAVWLAAPRAPERGRPRAVLLALGAGFIALAIYYTATVLP